MVEAYQVSGQRLWAVANIDQQLASTDVAAKVVLNDGTHHG
jgi:hypothetical protein